MEFIENVEPDTGRAIAERPLLCSSVSGARQIVGGKVICLQWN